MVKSTPTGYYTSTPCAGETVEAYVPSPIPSDLELNMEKLRPLLNKASFALGYLDGARFATSSMLFDIDYFIYGYVRREAVLSSQIEGTQSSISDLMNYEVGNLKVPLDDVQEVSCYVSAMDYGLSRLSELPLSSRLLREIHKKLMSNNRGGDKNPGEFRTSQNWIGGTRPGNAFFVPPPVMEMNQCMSDLEKFLHEEDNYYELIKIALAHVQFETIHPFLDGNGRVGRLLIILMLCDAEIISEPILDLSLFFKIHRREYYDRLQMVRVRGQWEEWIIFFLEAVIYCANEATQNIAKIMNLFFVNREKIINHKKSSDSILRVFEYMSGRPITKSAFVEEALGMSKPAALRNLRVLVKLGILEERKEKGTIFVYSDYLDILNKDTE